MPQNWDFNSDDDDDDDQQQTQTQSGKDPVRAQLRKLEKENKALQEQLAKAAQQVRETAITGVLTAKKLPAKVAKLIPADVEATEEAVSKWLGDYSDLFTPQSDTTTQPANTDGQPTPEGEGAAGDQALANLQNVYGRMAEVTQGASAPTGKDADLMRALVDPNLTPDALMKMIHAAGGGVGSG